MSWIESHEELPGHWKTQKFCKVSGKTIPEAVGHLHLLWYFTLKNAWLDGDLSKYDPKYIAESIYWKGDPNKMIEALQESKFLDDMKVHDWLHFCGDLIKKKIAYHQKKVLRVSGILSDSEKISEKFSEKSQKILREISEKPPKNLENSQLTIPNHTVPYQTIPNLKDKTKTVFIKDQEEKIKNLLTFQLGIDRSSEHFEQNFKEIERMAATKKDPYAWATDHINREIKAIENKKRFDGLVEDIVNKPKFFKDLDRLTLEDILVKDFGYQKDSRKFAEKMGKLWMDSKDQKDPANFAIEILKGEYETRKAKL